MNPEAIERIGKTLSSIGNKAVVFREEIRCFAKEIGNEAVVAKAHVWNGVIGALGNKEAKKTFQVIQRVIEEDPDRPATDARQEIEGRLRRKL